MIQMDEQTAAGPPAVKKEQGSSLEADLFNEAVVETVDYFTFLLGSEIYAVSVMSVQEIIGLPSLTRLPRTPNYVLGAMNLRGAVAPVLDLRLRLGLPDDLSEEPVVVVMRIQDKVVGLVVDGVQDVAAVSERDIQTPPEFSGGTVGREHLAGLVRQGEDMIRILDANRLLAPDIGNEVF